MVDPAEKKYIGDCLAITNFFVSISRYKSILILIYIKFTKVHGGSIGDVEKVLSWDNAALFSMGKDI